MTEGPRDVDLTSCDREPIHLLGHVQAFGCLIAVSDDWRVTHASENVLDILGLRPRDLIGTRFAAHFPEPIAHQLRGRTQTFEIGIETCRVFGIDLFQDARRFDVSIHAAGQGFLFEFEDQPEAASRGDVEIVQTLVAGLRRQPEMSDFLAMGASAMRHLCGFDRVMVYRFDEDGTGVVLAEAVASGVDRFHGLRFPASDIPRQARRLYIRNRLRLIADIDAPVWEVLPGTAAGDEGIDLSMAATRAVSPTHLQYLRNMGTRASMSGSIVRGQELWGLFACHHLTPRYVDFERRSAIELFTQLFTYELSERLNAEAADELARSKTLHDRIMMRVSSGQGLLDDFTALAEEINDLIEFDGIAVFCDDTYIPIGVAPKAAEFPQLLRFLNRTAAGEIYATDNLAAAYSQAVDLSDRIAGLLALPISRQPRDYIVLFRSEFRRTVTWAGRPAKLIDGAEVQARLHPRKSFQSWHEEVSGRSRPWSDATMNIANTLRYSLLEVVLKITDESSRATRHLQQKQELMVAELNHRVRNILDLITGIVSQAGREATSIDDFVAELDGRIRSMARAHDQLTRQNWETASLAEMLKTEVMAYSSPDRLPLRIDGPDVLLTPAAFSTLALVTHELVTNAAKYGALSCETGRIDVRSDVDGDGTLHLRWSESGGPPLQTQSREGFGSTIIQRSVPFDLQGRAVLSNAVTGLIATFEIPSRHFVISGPESTRDPGAPAPPGVATSSRQVLKRGAAAPLLSGDVLLVEDNIVIAMDVISKLKKLGAARVHTASNVAIGLQIIEAESLECAVLDVNLGRETSVAVANKLVAAGIPFVIATGYGNDGSVLSGYPGVGILKKPYDLDAMRSALEVEIGRAAEQAISRASDGPGRSA